MTDQELIHRFLEDPAGLAEAELEQLIAHLRAEPAKAVELREQLIIDDLLGQKLAVDRKNFTIMVQQRLADFEKGEEEKYDQVADLRAIAEAEIEKTVRPPGINPWVKFAGGIALIVVPILCFVVWRYQESAPRPVANVKELSGEVVRMLGSKTEALRLGQAISTGDSIVAAPGSTIVWKYKDGTTVRLLGDSKSQLDADSSTLAKQVRLETGELVASVAKQTRGDMIFTTPHATATVKGTELRLVVAELETQLDVTEGKVDFQRNGDGQVLRLAANESGVATAAKIKLQKVQWPVNRMAAAYLFEGLDQQQFARNPETGNPRDTPLEASGEASGSKEFALVFRDGSYRSEEGGKDALAVIKKSGEFACDILFTSDKTLHPETAVICAFGPQGSENFQLVQTGKELFVHLHRGIGKTPTVIELGEISLGTPHYASFACKDGRVFAVVDGVEVIANGEFQSTIASWEEGPLVLGADAAGKRAWHGEIAALALFDQFFDKALADANRERFKQLHP
ncbi:MAG: FecR domain-containing protein [Planctomycetales bacterium]|nr:FecR domain-containing protein [Planctomycetales bacterium]